MIGRSIRFGAHKRGGAAGGGGAVLSVDLPVTLNHLTGVFSFTIRRTGDTSGTTSGTWIASASALPGRTPTTAADFGGAYPTGTVTFNPGDVTKTVNVTPPATSNVSPE